MAVMSDFLKGKYLEQAKKLISFARSNNFYVTFYDQSKDKSPRIFITVYPKGKPKSIWERNDSASWYFYLNPEDKKDNFGGYNRPEKIGGSGKRFKNFEKFLNAIKERYERRYKNKESSIIDFVLKESKSRSRSQKGDVAQQLLEQGFFDSKQLPEGLEGRESLSGGNPVDVKEDFDRQNPEIKKDFKK